jgi:hypothetical protein
MSRPASSLILGSATGEITVGLWPLWIEGRGQVQRQDLAIGRLVQQPQTVGFLQELPLLALHFVGRHELVVLRTPYTLQAATGLGSMTPAVAGLLQHGLQNLRKHSADPG